MDRHTELTAVLARSTEPVDIQTVEMAVYHIRLDCEARHKRQVNELLKYIADLKERHDAENEEWRKLENAAMDKRHALADKELAA